MLGFSQRKLHILEKEILLAFVVNDDSLRISQLLLNIR